MRLHDSQCMECKAYAVLNGYCRQCGNDTNTKEDDAASSKQTDSERSDESKYSDYAEELKFAIESSSKRIGYE